MLLITNIDTSHIRTNSFKQICGGKYLATIVTAGRKNTKAGGCLFVCLVCCCCFRVFWFGFFYYYFWGIFYLLRISTENLSVFQNAATSLGGFS